MSVSVKTVEALLSDLRNRRGLGDIFDNADPDTQQEIRRSWENIVADAIAEAIRNHDLLANGVSR